MKKHVLVLLTCIPILAGYLINLLIFVPVAGVLLYYVLPIVVLVFWFYLGSQYSKTDWKTIPSILIGSATGIISLALYIWQFLARSDETRNIYLAGFSQMYSNAAPGYLIAGLAISFESDPHTIGITTMIAMEVLSLVLMIAVFTAGYLWGKTRRR